MWQNKRQKMTQNFDPGSKSEKEVHEGKLCIKKIKKLKICINSENQII